MTLGDISNIRLNSQQVASTKFTTAKEIVCWMGAIQAQDYAMAKWAIGTRLPGSTDNMIENAIDNAWIIRTHLLRPTWHFVSADDIYWMLELSFPQVKSQVKSRHKELGLTESLISKSNSLIQDLLKGGNHLTREEIITELRKTKIDTGNNRASHILFSAEIDGIICSGKSKNKKQTYALLSERVAKTETFTREESLGKLARIYFSSRGPASLQDFAWWSGLRVGDARNALEMIKHDFIEEKRDQEIYWFANSFAVPRVDNAFARLLPAYDEFLIAYKDRSASLPLNQTKMTVSENGIFRPVIVIDGQVIGLWKRSIKNERVILEADFFKQCDKKIKILIEKAGESFVRFLNKNSELVEFKF